MNLRQIISVVSTFAVCVPTYLYGKDVFGSEVTSWITIVFGMGIAMMGFFTKNGLPFEKYLKVMIDFYLFPVKRKNYVPDTHEKNVEIEYNELYTSLYKDKKSQKRKGKD